MTISRRVVLLTAAAVAIAVVAGSGATYVLVRHELRAGVDDELRGSRPQALFFSKSLAKTSGDTPLRVGLPPKAFGDVTGVAQVVNRKGVRVSAPAAGSALPITPLTRAVASGRRGVTLADQHVKGVHLRVLTARTPSGDVLQVARPLTEVDRTLQRLRWVLLAVALTGTAVAGALGLLVARRALRPVRKLSAAAARLAATQDLSTRLPADGRDELAQLGGSFNAMLGALERSREAQRQLVADASHELRTPLTSTRTNVELLARAPDLPAAEREQIVGDVCDQLSELSVLVGDLVDLARPDATDTGDLSVRESLRLDLLAGDALEAARLHARGHELCLDAEPCIVDGDPARLHRALRNLLDNAVKYSPPGAPVEVAVRDGAVVVRDHGPGIAPEDLPHVFDRFYRAPDARGLPGSGLGLAIVRQVAEEHGGSVTAAPDPDGGTRLTLALPAAQLASATS